MKLAVARCVDEGAGGPRGVVEQRLVPLRGSVVQVDGRGCGLERAQPIVVVVGVEKAHVQDRADARDGFGGNADRATADGVVIGLRPAVGVLTASGSPPLIAAFGQDGASFFPTQWRQNRLGNTRRLDVAVS